MKPHLLCAVTLAASASVSVLLGTPKIVVNPNPGWLVEGISDYVRWYHFEPQSRGAEVRRLANARHDASYRVTANFLNWVIEHRDRDLIHQLNAVMRQGNYREDLWKTWTGRTVQELGEEWKTDLARKLKSQENAE